MVMPDKVFIRNVPDQLWRAFKARASLDGLTMSQAIQIAIEGYLRGNAARGGAAEKDPFAGIVGLGASGDDDVSEHHDRYLSLVAEPPPPEYGDGEDPG